MYGEGRWARTLTQTLWDMRAGSQLWHTQRDIGAGTGSQSPSLVPPGWPSPSSELGLIFCKMRSMCWDVCNLLHAVFSPWGHTPPHKPRHTVTHSDTSWRAAPRAQPVLGDGPVTHTLPLLRSHPHPGRSRCSRRAPPAGPRRRFCAPFPSPRRETAAGRAGMSSHRRPPGRPGLTRSRCRAAPRPESARGGRLSGAPCRALRGGSRRWRVGSSG